MASSSLVTDARSVRTRESRQATGDIWVVIDGREFPMSGWNDFAVVVLRFWTSALRRLIGNQSKREIVDFMEGPFCVALSMANPTTLRLCALEGADRLIEGPIGEVPIEKFVLELTSQARAILAECGQQGWWSKDADILLKSLTKLEAKFHVNSSTLT